MVNSPLISQHLGFDGSISTQTLQDRHWDNAAVDAFERCKVAGVGGPGAVDGGRLPGG